MTALPSGTVTFMFTDIEGSTRLWDEHPDTTGAALARHDAILREAVAGQGGYVFSTGGDGIAAAFARSADAVAAAVHAQRSLQREPWPGSIGIRVRIGIHTGEAEERDGDYFGAPLNRAARLMAAAHGGQIVVSDVTANLLPPIAGVGLVDLGSHRLRGFVDATRVFAVKADGIEWVDTPLSTSEGTRGNLSRPLNEWFGPVAELHRRAGDLARRRLITLTGPGGVGKTRLAAEIGAVVADEFPDGVWVIELAPIADPDAVHAATAATLGVLVQEGRSALEMVLDWLEHKRLLLIVDNCEHVIAPVRELVAATVARRPSVTVVATSREPLGLTGERVIAVPSLVAADAVALFSDRALAAEESLRFGDQDLEVIEQICERLDGIPLAIELAAARVRSMGPVDLLARLDDRFRLLRGGGHGGVERHQTLLATVAWSYQLLTEPQRALFERLSVFAGGFDLRAAEAVCQGDLLEEWEVVDVLRDLVDKSLVTVEHREGAPARYRLLETLRQYGEERLEESGGTEALRRLHLDYFLTVAEHAHDLWDSPRCRDGKAVFDEEWDNLRTAHSTALALGEVGRAQHLFDLIFDYGEIALRYELVDWGQRTIDAEVAAGCLRPDTCARTTWLNLEAGRYVRAAELALQGIDAAPSPGHPDAFLCWAFYGLAALVGAGDRERAVPHLEAGVHAEDPRTAFRCAAALGGIVNRDRPQFAMELVERGRSLAQQIHSPALLATVAFYEAAILSNRTQPDFERSFMVTREGIELARATAAPFALAANLAAHALSASVLAHPDADQAIVEALTYVREVRSHGGHAAQALFAAIFYLSGRGDQEGATVLLACVKSRHPAFVQLVSSSGAAAALIDSVAKSAHAEWNATGVQMTIDEALAYAIGRVAGS